MSIGETTIIENSIQANTGIGAIAEWGGGF
jgi:hypothetical protein